MITSSLSRPLIAILSIATVGAADVDFLDLRLGGGVLSNTFKGSSSTTVVDNSTHVSTTSDSNSNGRDSDGNYRGQIQLVWGHLGPVGGLIFGAGIAANNARYENGSLDADVTTPVVDILLGYGIAVSKAWHFELTPFAGAGRAYYSVSDNGSSSTSKDWGKYYEYGAKIGTYLSLESGIQVGVEVPYLVGRFDAEYHHDGSNDSYTVTDSRRNEGFGLLVTVGVRF